LRFRLHQCRSRMVSRSSRTPHLLAAYEFVRTRAGELRAEIREARSAATSCTTQEPTRRSPPAFLHVAPQSWLGRFRSRMNRINTVPFTTTVSRGGIRTLHEQERCSQTTGRLVGSRRRLRGGGCAQQRFFSRWQRHRPNHHPRNGCQRTACLESKSAKVRAASWKRAAAESVICPPKGDQRTRIDPVERGACRYAELHRRRAGDTARVSPA